MILKANVTVDTSSPNNPHVNLEAYTKYLEKLNISGGILDGNVIEPFSIRTMLTSARYLELPQNQILPNI